MTQSIEAASRGASTSPCISRLTHESVVSANISTLSTLMPPVATAQPIIGGKAPAAPPITMFCGVRRFSQTV